MVWVDLQSAAASADLARLRQHWWLNKHRINAYNRDKQTPLHLACINGHADVVQFLVKKKCKLNPCDKLNKSPLMKAVEHQHGDCAAILLEHGANHAHRGVSGNTALHFAVLVSSKSLVELLLEHGADIDAKNNLGYTPLTLAITENSEEMVKFLLQKGADVNALDNVSRTPLTVAAVFGNKKIIQLLLHHGAVFPKSNKGYYPSQSFTKVVQNVFSTANEGIESSCSETAPVIPLETPALAESCDVPKEEAAKKEDNGPAADQNKVSLHSITVQPHRGDYKGKGAKKKEDKRSLCNPETDPKGEGKMWASVWFPAANSNRLDARSAAGVHSKDVLPEVAAGEAKKEDGDSSWGSEPYSEVLDEAAATVVLPADACRMWQELSVAKERGKGAFPAAAAGEAKKEDGDSSWDSEPFSEIVEEVFASVQHPAADRKGVGVCSAAAEHSKGVLQPAGGAEDDDSPWDSETDSEGEGKVPAAVQLPVAGCNRLDALSAAAECRKGVLKQARTEEKKEDEVLQPSGGEVKQEENYFPWDSETDSKGWRKVSAGVQLPAARQNRVGVSSAAVECGKGARAEQKKHFISSSENKGEDLQLKLDSSTLTDSEQDEQPLARQKVDKILKKNSLEGAPLGTVKTSRRKEQKLLLEKLERCKTRLKDLKEPLNKNNYYAESGKNAPKEKKVIAILRNLQGHLVDSFDSSAAAIPQLEEHIQRLQIQMARLEATIQQQAKTIEVFETIHQISCLSKPLGAFPVHDPQNLVPYSYGKILK